MAHALPERTYWEWAHYVRPALIATCRKAHCTDEEDVASDTINDGFHALYPEDPSAHVAYFDPDTGREGLCRWLLGILSFNLLDWHRWRIRRAARHAPLDEETVEESRVTAWLSSRPDPDLLEDAMVRLEAAPLTEPQRSCLALKLCGWTIERTADYLGIEPSRVRSCRTMAIKKLKAVRPDEISAIDLDPKLWRSPFKVTRYFAPQTTGAGLAKQDLRNGTCSVTRKEVL